MKLDHTVQKKEVTVPKKYYFLLGLLCFSMCTFFAIKQHLLKLSYHPGSGSQIPSTQHKNKVLIVLTSKAKIDGRKVYVSNLYQQLKKRGYGAQLLVSNNAPLLQEIQALGLPCYSCNTFHITHKYKSWQPGLVNAIQQICLKENIQVVHTNGPNSLTAALDVRKEFPIKILTVNHNPSPPITQQANVVLSVNKIEAEKNGLTCLAPFMNEKLFSSNITQQEVIPFFAQTFGIALSNAPILCKIAVMDKHLVKGHPVALKAVANLIHEKKIPVQLVIAGNGPGRKQCVKLIKELKIEKNVYLLGRVDQKLIPHLLKHIDINILARSYEHFGIAALEAALMKKPSIISDMAGSAHWFIKHRETGLLFKHGNPQDLSSQIQYLLENKKTAEQLGNNAYKLFKAEFNQKVLVSKMITEYKHLINNVA